MIANAKVVGDGIAYETYARQAEGVKRGHRGFIVSRSELTNLALNPKRWLDGYREEESDTDATKWGSLIECLAGLSGKFEDKYSVAPAEYEDEKTGKMKPWNWNATVCKDWREAQGDKEVLKSDLKEKALLALDALSKDAEVSELFACSRKQVMVVGTWKDKDTGLEIPLRCLLDLVPNKDHPAYGKCLADFKTARNGCPDIWARVVDDAGYDVQAALSRDLYVAATNEDRTDWLFPVQENVHPYHVVKPMPALTAEFFHYGQRKYEAALALYAKCLATNHWPSYSTRDRLVFGPCQYIAPDTLYSYRQSGGLPPSHQDYQPEPTGTGGLKDANDINV